MKIKEYAYFLRVKGPIEVLKKIRNKGKLFFEGRILIKKYRNLHLLTKKERKWQKRKQFKRPICFSLVTPLYNTPKKFLIELIKSMEKQTYSNWELCLVDASDAGHEYLTKICYKYSQKDKRIRYKKISENMGISQNTNECLKMAKGDYIGLLDHDDILHESALYENMVVISEKNADFIYSDEAKFSKKPKNAIDFNFKPGFAKDDLRSHNYICHFTVFKKDLLDDIGGFRSDFDGSQDHDMVLRLTEKANTIIHIPKVLYYWRVHPVSVSMNLDSKSYAVDAAIRAVGEQLKRTKEYGIVESNLPYQTIYRIHYEIDIESLIKMVVYNVELVEEYELFKTKVLEKTKCKNIEFIPVYNDEKDLAGSINNIVKDMIQSYVLIVDINCVPISDQWIEELLMFAQRDDVCAVSPKGYFPNGTVAYAGISLDKDNDEKVKYLCCGISKEDQGYEAMLRHVRNVTAAWPRCCMISKRSWEQLDGFSIGMAGYEVVDYCLKGKKKNFWCVCTCFAEMLYTSKDTFSIEDRKNELFETKWKEDIKKDDLFYNPNLKKLGLL